MSIRTLNRTRHSQKSDEFYTQLEDIELELKHYTQCFKNKIVYCNADDYKRSNFVKYFKTNFKTLGLKKLISTNYINQQNDLFCSPPERPSLFEFDGYSERVTPLSEDGDFRSGECIELLKQSDVVVTNPPFSLLKEYIPHLAKFNKQFLILGVLNAIKYTAVFPLIKARKMWFGHKSSAGDTWFDVPPNYIKKSSVSKIINGKEKLGVSGVGWFTNLGQNNNRPEIILTKKYVPDEYPKFDNYNAINVNKTCDIPKDYSGLMGGPISFFNRYNSNQFEIVDLILTPVINERSMYSRIVIRNKQL